MKLVPALIAGAVLVRQVWFERRMAASQESLVLAFRDHAEQTNRWAQRTVKQIEDAFRRGV